AEALRGRLLARRIDEAFREPDAVQVRLRAGQAVEQVQAAVKEIKGAIAALGEEPSRGNVKLRQAQLTTRRGRPGQQALRVHPRIKPMAGNQEPEERAQAEDRD